MRIPNFHRAITYEIQACLRYIVQINITSSFGSKQSARAQAKSTRKHARVNRQEKIGRGKLCVNLIIAIILLCVSQSLVRVTTDQISGGTIVHTVTVVESGG